MPVKCAKLHLNSKFFDLLFTKRKFWQEKVFFEKYHYIRQILWLKNFRKRKLRLKETWEKNQEMRIFSVDFCFIVRLANFILKKTEC